MHADPGHGRAWRNCGLSDGPSADIMRSWSRDDTLGRFGTRAGWACRPGMACSLAAPWARYRRSAGLRRVAAGTRWHRPDADGIPRLRAARPARDRARRPGPQPALPCARLAAGAPHDRRYARAERVIPEPAGPGYAREPDIRARRAERFDRRAGPGGFRLRVSPGVSDTAWPTRGSRFRPDRYRALRHDRSTLRASAPLPRRRRRVAFRRAGHARAIRPVSRAPHRRPRQLVDRPTARRRDDTGWSETRRRCARFPGSGAQAVLRLRMPRGSKPRGRAPASARRREIAAGVHRPARHTGRRRVRFERAAVRYRLR